MWTLAQLVIEVLETHHAEGVKCNSQGQRPWDRLKKKIEALKGRNDLRPHIIWTIIYAAPSALGEINCTTTWADGPGFFISRPWRFTSSPAWLISITLRMIMTVCHELA